MTLIGTGGASNDIDITIRSVVIPAQAGILNIYYHWYLLNCLRIMQIGDSWSGPGMTGKDTGGPRNDNVVAD
jgi:hypothetical protein